MTVGGGGAEQGRKTNAVEVRSLLGDEEEIGRSGGMHCILHEMLSHDPDSSAEARLITVFYPTEIGKM